MVNVLGKLAVLPLALAASMVAAEPSITTTKSRVFSGQISPSCTFSQAKLPANTIVLAAGSYGGKPLDMPIENISGHQPSGLDIEVHADKPVALMLFAYEPTLWNIFWTKGTKIAAVYVSGYHSQFVAGLPKNVPVINSSMANKGECGYNYDSNNLAWLNPKAQELFKLDVTRVYNKHKDGIIAINEASKPPKGALITDPSTPPESFRLTGVPLAGEAGLNQAIEQGVLRKTTPEDVAQARAYYQARAEAKKKANPTSALPPVAGAEPKDRALKPDGMPSLGPNTYTVIGPFTYPAGLYGGHSQTFLVLKGVPKPQGNQGHSTTYDLNNPIEPCLGTLCNLGR